MEHTVVLGASAFIQEIGPTLPRNKKTKKNSTASVDEVYDDEDAERDEYDEDEADWDALDELPDDVQVDLPVDFEAGDVLGKVLGFINQVNFPIYYSIISDFL